MIFACFFIVRARRIYSLTHFYAHCPDTQLDIKRLGFSLIAFCFCQCLHPQAVTNFAVRNLCCSHLIVGFIRDFSRIKMSLCLSTELRL